MSPFLESSGFQMKIHKFLAGVVAGRCRNSRPGVEEEDGTGSCSGAWEERDEAPYLLMMGTCSVLLPEARVE
jgi:hypothetical protein